MAGIKLPHGGKLKNTGFIYGYAYGVEIYGGTGTVTNASGASITATGDNGDAIDLEDGGMVTNMANGAIEGENGIVIFGSGTVFNSGDIGVYSGGDYGFGEAVFISGGTGIVGNFSGASIIGGQYSFAAVMLDSGGKVSNQAKASIINVPSIAVYIGHGAGIVSNGGVISGAVGVEIFDATGTVTNLSGGSITGDIELTAGGMVTNAANAVVTTGFYGIDIYGGSGTVTNAGTITSDSKGIVLAAGGTVNNKPLGNIKCTYKGFNLTSFSAVGVSISGNNGVVTNGGSIESYGAKSVGVYLKSGAMLSNLGKIIETGDFFYSNKYFGGYAVDIARGGEAVNGASGSISSQGINAIVVQDGSATIKNSGIVSDTENVYLNKKIGAGSAIYFDGASGVVNNMKGGIISSTVGAGIAGTGGFTVTNAGTITGKTAAILFAGSGANLLTLKTGSILNGSVIGSVAKVATNTLALEGSGTADNLFLNFNRLSVQAAGTWTLGAASNFAKTIVSSGTLDFDAAVTGTATCTIAGAATLEFGSTVADTQTIDFIGKAGVLDLGSPAGFAGILSGFDTVGSNDAVQLLGAWSISGFASTSTQSSLTLKDGTESASLVFDGSYKEALFVEKVIGGTTTLTYS